MPSIPGFIKLLCFICSHLFSFIAPLPIIHCHSLSFVITRCHPWPHVVFRCHSIYDLLSFVVTRCNTRCHSLCHSCRSLSLIVIRCTTRCHSLSLVVNRCTTHLPFYKRSLSSYVEEYLFLQNTF